jgi:hypothetical protein
MLRLISARRLRRLEGRVHDLETDRERFLVSNVKLTTERALLLQARDHAEVLATYWRVRCERFLDQIGASSGIICAPTMTEPAPAPEDDIRTVFAALGRSELRPSSDSERPAAAAPQAAAVNGIDPAVAAAAVQDVLANVGT